MTENKSIIIDGVDVSGCRYLFDDTSYKRSKTSCSITLKDCKYLGNNCYYKQLKAKEQECERLKKDKSALELRLDELTSPVNVEDCEHSVFNGEYIACRYYEGQRCDDADFANCMYRENIRLKQQLDKLKAEKEGK